MTWKRPGYKRIFSRTKSNGPRRPSVPDGGWGWMVTFTSGMGLLVCMSLSNSYGILYAKLVDKYSYEMTSLTLIGSTHSALMFAGGVLVTPLIERFGIRPVLACSAVLMSIGCLVSAFVTSYVLLFVFMGIVTGIGASFSFVTFYIAIDGYFDKKKSIAVPLASFGPSLSNIFPLLIQKLVDKYDFQGTMLVLSAIYLNIIVCGAVIFPLKTQGFKNKLDVQAVKTEPLGYGFVKKPGFIVYMISNCLYIMGYYVPFGLLPETSAAKGFDLDNVSLVLLVTGLIQILGRVIFGFLSYRFSRYVMILWIVFLIGSGLPMVIIPFAWNLVDLFLFGVSWGIFTGGTNLGFNLSLRHLVDSKYFGRAISLAAFAQGVGGLAGNPVAAFVQTTTKNNDMAYYIGCGVYVVAGLILIPFSAPKKQTIIDYKILVENEDINVVIVESGSESPKPGRRVKVTDDPKTKLLQKFLTEPQIHSKYGTLQ